MIVVIIIIMLTLILVVSKKDNMYKSIQESLTNIDNLDGIQFENYFAKLLKKIGYNNVQVTKSSGDYGTDIIAYKDCYKYAFQCKRYSKKIGPKPIGEVLRGMRMYNCSKGVVITNNYFTEQAKKEAKVCDIELWDRNKLIFILKEINKGIDKEIDKGIDKEFLGSEEDINKHIENKIKIKEMTYTQNIEISKRIQHAYYELGYNVKVVEVNTHDKYVTTYKAIYDGNPAILLAGTQIIGKIGYENIRISDINNKYIKIIIPKEIIY